MTFYQDLRNALKYAEEFSIEAVTTEQLGDSSEFRLASLQLWLREQADKHHSDTRVGARAWEVFEGLVVMDGQCSPGDYDLFGLTAHHRCARTFMRSKRPI